MDIKTALNNLLAKGEITQAEFEKAAAVFVNPGIVEEAGAKGFTRAGGIAKDVLQTLGLTALTGIAGYQLYDIMKQKHNERVGYQKMMEKNPILSEYPEEQVRDFYGVVETFSPRSASNPLVSGALVNKMIQFGGVDHKIVQDLASIEGPSRNIIYDVASKAGQSLVSFPSGGGGGGGGGDDK